MGDNHHPTSSQLSSLFTTTLEEFSQAAIGRHNPLSTTPSDSLHPHITGLNQNTSSSTNVDASTAAALTNLEQFSSLTAGTPPRDLFGSPSTPAAMTRSKFGGPGNGRPTVGNFRGSASVVPPSALYSVVISPSEMASHEATNFKNVKGVYKNCRGIWAAQWTDERGQRHTKYFNPKYYSTEFEARREAFKFKLHITREIELRGGVQKRRIVPIGVTGKMTAGMSTPVKGADSFLEQPYIRERQKRPTRKAAAKARSVRSTGFQNLYDSTGYNPSFDSSWLRTADYSMASIGQQQQQAGSSLLHPRNYGSNQVIGADDLDASGLTNSSCSPLSVAPGSPPTTLYYNPQTFDTIFLPPSSSTFSNQFLQNNSSSSSSSGYSTGHGNSYRLDNTSAGNEESFLNLCSALPPGTTFCLCGCGELAIAPSHYAPHHHAALSASEQINTSTELSRGEANAIESYTSNLSALFPVASDFLAQFQAADRSTPLSSRRKRQAEESLDALLEATKRVNCGVAPNDGVRKRITKDIGENRGNSSGSTVSSTSFPFVESWMKSYSPYASYPNNQQGQLLHNEASTMSENEASIAALLDEVTNNPDHQLRRATMLLLTSSGGSSNGEGPQELSAADEFIIDAQTSTTPSFMPLTGASIANEPITDINSKHSEKNDNCDGCSPVERWIEEGPSEILGRADL